MEVVITDKRKQLAEIKSDKIVKYMMIDGKSERKLSYISTTLPPIYLKLTQHTEPERKIMTYFGPFTFISDSTGSRISAFTESILSIMAIYEIKTSMHYIKYCKNCDLNTAKSTKAYLADNINSPEKALQWCDFVKVKPCRDFGVMDPFLSFIHAGLTAIPPKTPLTQAQIAYIDNISYVSGLLKKHYDFNPFIEVNDVVQQPTYLHPSLWVKPDIYRIIPVGSKREIMIGTPTALIPVSSCTDVSLCGTEISCVFDGMIDGKTKEFTIIHPIIFEGKNVSSLQDTERMQICRKTQLPFYPAEPFDEKTSFSDEKLTGFSNMILFYTNGGYTTQRVYELNYTKNIRFAVTYCPENMLGREPFIEQKGYSVMLLFTRGGANTKFQNLWDSLPYSYFSYTQMPVEKAILYNKKICEFDGASLSFQGLSPQTHPDDYDTATYITQLKHKQITFDSIRTSIFNVKSLALKDFVNDQLRSGDSHAIKIVIDMPFKVNAVEVQTINNPNKIYSDNPGELKYAALIIQYGDYIDPSAIAKFVIGGGSFIKISPTPTIQHRQIPDFKIVSVSSTTTTFSWVKYTKILANDPDNAHATLGFVYKFTRIHNESIPSECYIPTANALSKMTHNPELGALLCYAEFLITQPINSRVTAFVNATTLQQLTSLLPCFKYNDQKTATKETTDILIMEDIDMKQVDALEPTIAFCGVSRAGTYYNGRYILKPYSNDPKMYLCGTWSKDKMMTLDPLIWLEKSGGYQKYRSSCFTYKLPPSKIGFDHCYDCRAYIWITGRVKMFLSKNGLKGVSLPFAGGTRKQNAKHPF